ncbi:hypothetical protein EBZ39_10225 [bacterium]|nr:hypothetical protein [bacterium]
MEDDVKIDGHLVAGTEEGKKHLISAENRLDTVEIEVRMARMELEEAEKHANDERLDDEMRLRWAKRVDSLGFMLTELGRIKKRLEEEIKVSGRGVNPGTTEEMTEKVNAAVALLGEEAAASDFGADLVVLYKEVGQNITSFREAISRYKVHEMETVNGVTVETLAEEMRNCYPDMPVFWRRSNAISLLKYLTVIRATGSNTLALKAANCPRRIVTYMQASSPVFGAVLNDSLDESTDSLEDEARRRAVEGVDEPVFYQGAVVGHVKKYSDELLKMLLRANRQTKYIVNKTVQQPLINVNNTFNLEGVNIDGLRDRLVSRIEGRVIDAEVNRQLDKA